ncbi:MAG: VCBS repeat-containing protein, partial [Anaerolineales bacterium]|nr:VCBS repeat-containing protein [Anaerolineales bacterium]
MKTFTRLTVILLLTLILSSWQAKTISQAASTLGLSAIPTAFTPNSYDIYDGALGDVDNDGDLDLVVAINDLPPSPPYVDGRLYLYYNIDGVLQANVGWSSSNTGAYRSVSWGDVDNDGDLDLATSSPYNPARVFLNNSGTLGGGAWWNSNGNNGGDTAWGDIDNDGDLDLVVGMAAYFNTGGNLNTAPGWTPALGADCYEIALGDINGDGWLDLATANRLGKAFIFFNTGGTFETNHSWESTDTGAWSVALADINGDGRLDMALGDGEASASLRVFFNSPSGLETTPSWSKTGLGRILAVSWGDVDNDGDLDLAGSSSYRYIFLNDAGALQADPAWTSSDEATSNAIPWGDLDNDGDLEMVSANSGSPSKVYFNSAPFLANAAAWSGNASNASSVAWGDVDGDGDLDLAVSGMHQNRLHLNDGTQLNSSPVWTSPEDTNARAAAWADVDGDGDLDLAVANSLWWSGSYWYGDGRNRIYYNTGSGLTSASPWVSSDSVPHTCLAWGDVDGDGDLDLASGVDGYGDVLYLNNNGALSTSPSWYSNNIGMTEGLAWGDVDNDGDLDLAVVSYGTPNKLYRNDNGVLTSSPVWQANVSEGSQGVAWSDVDGDGDLDLVVGNFWGFSKIYKNNGGTLEVNASWQNLHNDGVRGIALGDVNGDGFPDLATAASNNDPKRLYMNQNGLMDMLEIWSAPEIIQSFGAAWGDMNRDGILDLAASGYSGGNSMVYLGTRPAVAPVPTSPTTVVIHPYSTPAPTFNQPSSALAPANFYAVPAIRESAVISITYNLFDPSGLPFRQVRAFYSQDGGGSWVPAQPSAATPLTNLGSTVYPTITVTNTHVFGWDVYASSFFGLSDNVIFRLEALPPLTTPSGQATRLFQMPLVSTQTFPFRVRGTQVRVFQEGDPLDTPVPGAMVYRIPSGQASGGTINDPTGQPYQTDQNGYLKGRGQLSPGDLLVALLPVQVHDKYTLYYTSAAPTETGLDATPVGQPGVQELTVSKGNPLALFNLKISLEWDARND